MIHDCGAVFLDGCWRGGLHEVTFAEVAAEETDFAGVVVLVDGEDFESVRQILDEGGNEVIFAVRQGLEKGVWREGS